MSAVNCPHRVKQAGQVVDPAAAAAAAARHHGFQAPRCFGKGVAHLAHSVCASRHITTCRQCATAGRRWQAACYVAMFRTGLPRHPACACVTACMVMAATDDKVMVATATTSVGCDQQHLSTRIHHPPVRGSLMASRTSPVRRPSPAAQLSASRRTMPPLAMLTASLS